MKDVRRVIKELGPESYVGYAEQVKRRQANIKEKINTGFFGMFKPKK